MVGIIVAMKKKKEPLVVTLSMIAMVLVCLGSVAIAMCLALGVFELPEWARWLAFAFVIISGTALGYFLLYLGQNYRERYLEKAAHVTGSVQSTFIESTQNEQVKDKRMTPAKDSDNRVVVHLPTWMRVFGGICFLGFGAMSYGLAQGIGEDTESLVLFLCVGLPLTFLGIYFLGYTSQFIFDHTLGNMTIRMGVGPFMYKSRTFSKKEVQYCVVSTSEAPATHQSPSITLWQVQLRISRRKKDLKTTVNNKERANYLAARIRAFVWSD